MIENQLKTQAFKIFIGGVQLILLIICFIGCNQTNLQKEEQLPNIILINADDLGYGSETTKRMN